MFADDGRTRSVGLVGKVTVPRRHRSSALQQSPLLISIVLTMRPLSVLIIRCWQSVSVLLTNRQSCVFGARVRVLLTELMLMLSNPSPADTLVLRNGLVFRPYNRVVILWVTRQFGVMRLNRSLPYVVYLLTVQTPGLSSRYLLPTIMLLCGLTLNV